MLPAWFVVQLVQVQRNARDARTDEADGPLRAEQVERIRKMLLAFSATCAWFCCGLACA